MSFRAWRCFWGLHKGDCLFSYLNLTIYWCLFIVCDILPFHIFKSSRGNVSGSGVILSMIYGKSYIRKAFRNQINIIGSYDSVYITCILVPSIRFIIWVCAFCYCCIWTCHIFLTRLRTSHPESWTSSMSGCLISGWFLDCGSPEFEARYWELWHWTEATKCYMSRHVVTGSTVSCRRDYVRHVV